MIRAATAAAVDGDDVMEQIEKVATDLFIRNGYHGVSYLAIAKELGITHSNVHYYYRTKPSLAQAVLKRAASETLAATQAIWSGEGLTLLDKFVHMRDWIYRAYLRYNPDGKGGRPWGLLSRFSMDADALGSDMRQMIRATLKQLEDDVRAAVETAIAHAELQPDAPLEGITLQIISVMYQTGQLTRHAAGFSRLDALLMWTATGIFKAYGSKPGRPLAWPPLLSPKQHFKA